jgi:hypothetical protein
VTGVLLSAIVPIGSVVGQFRPLGGYAGVPSAKGALIMKLRHSLAVSTMAAGLLLVGGGAAIAAPLDHSITSRGTGTLSNSIVSPGQAVSFCGSGYRANSSVAVSVDGRYYKTVTADGSGSFCARVRLSRIGQHALRARGVGPQGQVRVVSAMLTVRGSVTSGTDNEASGSTSDGGLPFTGAEVGLMAAGAALLVGAGVGARIVGRRRRSTIA